MRGTKWPAESGMDDTRFCAIASVIFGALVFGLLSSFVKPALKFLTFPLALVTLGIAWFFVAMFILWLTTVIVSGFHVEGFWTLVGATVIVWAVGALAARWLFPRKPGMKDLVKGRFRRV